MKNKLIAILCSIWYVFIFYVGRPIDCVITTLTECFPYPNWGYLGEVFKLRWNHFEDDKDSFKEYILSCWEGKYE